MDKLKPTVIILDVNKPGAQVYNLSNSFNARVGDNQIPIVIKYIERGIVERMKVEQLTPFMAGYVGQPDEDEKVTAETGIAVSYHGSSSNIIGGGKVKMDLPGAMFPQEGMFYGFFGLENDKGKRVTTNTVRFIVENDNPDMYVDAEPFRSELQKLLDWATAQADSAIGDIKTKWETLRDTILEMIKQGDTDLTSLKNRMGFAEDELNTLLKKIEEAGIFTKADFDKIVQPILDDLSVSIVVDQSVDIGGQLDPKIKKQLDDYIAGLPEGFKIGIISDAHYEDHYDNTYFGSHPYTQDAYQHLTAFNYLADHVDVLIANGDNTNGNNPVVDHTIAEGYDYADKVLMQNSRADKFVLLGNHDDNTAFKYSQYGNNKKILPSYPNTIISEAEFKKMFRTSELINDEVRNGDSLYFYKDYEEAKVRLIGLNSEDIPEDAKNEDGSLKYDRYWYLTYSQAQLDWVAKTALMGVPEDYRVIVISHVPINGKEAHQYNQDLMIGILNAFATGNSFSASSADSVPDDLKLAINVDYTSQGARDLIGNIAGHVHHEGISSENNFKVCTVTCDLNGEADRVGTSNSMGFNVVTILPTERKVKLSGFGHAVDQNFVY